MNKKRLGRRMMTLEERKTKYMPWYMSKAWQARKLAKKLKVIRRNYPDKAKELGL